MIEFIGNFYVQVGLAALLAILVLVFKIVRHRMHLARLSHDIERHRTPKWGRHGKIFKPKKKKPFRWQPEQDYELLHFDLTSDKSSHQTTILVPKDKTRRK